MHETLPLFEAPATELKSRLAGQLRKAAAAGLFIGASSWKYEDWIGQIYSRERYLSRSRFSRKRFNEECLTEYAETFSIVCGDFAFYQFPSPDFWRRLFGQVPAPFQFAFKIPEEITIPIFPDHPRYGARAGYRNPNFLSSQLLQTQFLKLLLPYSDRVSLLMFEFAASTGFAFMNAQSFAQAISKFFASLPKTFRYGVELRQPLFLEPAYFRALRDNGVTHVFNSWTDMPGIETQVSNSEAFTANFTAARALLRPGRVYEDAVRMFSPYYGVREPNAVVRAALRDLLVRAKRRSEPSFLFVNNRFEGFAPGTIAAITEKL